MNVQYALGNDYLLEVGYVGTRSSHRPGQIQFNQSLLASPQNPINGETTNSINNVAARQFYQGVPQGSLFTKSIFIGNYNSLQTQITKRMQHGFQLQASYVWSKNLDEVNAEGGNDTFELQLPSNDQHNLRQSSYGLAGDDRSQRAVINSPGRRPGLPHLLRYRVIYLPIGSSQASRHSVGRSPERIRRQRRLGLWKLQQPCASHRAKSFDPGNPVLTRDRKWPISGRKRVHAGPRSFERNKPRRPGLRYQQRRYRSRTRPAQPGLGNRTSISRDRDQQLPVPNRVLQPDEYPQFANPNNNLGYGDPTLPNPTASSSFGQITSTSTNPRIIQFALKYLF